MKKIKILDIIVSVVIGVAIWAYVVGVKDPVTTATVRLVPVQLTNVSEMEKSNLAIAGSGEYTVDVVVGGARSVVNDAKVEDLIATADVSGLHVGQNYITVEVEAPSNMTVNEIRTQKIQVYVDNAVSVEKELKIFTANLPEGQELGSIEAQVDTILVNGAQSLVNNVVDVQATIDASDRVVDEALTENISLIPVDADGNKVVGVKLSQDSITIKSSLYNTKEVALNIPLEGEFAEDVVVRSEIIPASVVIKGPSEILADIWQIDARAIDKSVVTETCSIPLELNLPDGIEAAHAYRNLTVDYEIKGMEEKAISFNNDNVRFSNIPAGKTVTLIDDFVLNFKLFSDDVSDFSADDISIAINLQNLPAGQHEVSITSVDILTKDVTLLDNLEGVKLKVEIM